MFKIVANGCHEGHEIKRESSGQTKIREIREIC